MKSQLCAALALASLLTGAPASADPVPVRTMQVIEGDAEAVRQFFGQVHAIDTVDLAFEVGGRLIELDAPEGGRLKAGALLARLDPAPFDRAVRRAELTLAQAERDLKRAEALAARNVTSAVQAADAATERDMALVALEEAKEARADSELIAPFDALVADRIAANHAMIEPGQPVLRLHDMSEIRVRFDLPERLLEQISSLADVRFEGIAVGRDQPLALEFREFKAETGAIGQSYDISLAIVDPAEIASLIPGCAITVRASLSMPGAPIFVPPTAVATAPSGQAFVVKVTEEGDALIARHVPVTVTVPGGSRVAVEGLHSGDEIVIAGAHLLEDGREVSRFTSLAARGE